MSTNEFIYDVAFSFLSEDEPVATQINDLLQDRLKTFLYSQKQGEIAGTDGEKTFNRVFGEESRLVVVLYRKGWGETPWTRIEEAAIKRRGWSKGYDFVKVIRLDNSEELPVWHLPAQLWIGLKRFGADGAAAVIEARVQEFGGQPREESILDRAARLERQIKVDQRRKQYRFSGEAVQTAEQEVVKLSNAITAYVEQINSGTSLRLKVKRSNRQIVVLGLAGRSLSVDWEFESSNNLDGFELDVSLWDRHPPMPGLPHFEKPNRLKQISFDFDLLPTERTGWIPTHDRKRAFSTEDLADHLLKFYMDSGQ